MAFSGLVIFAISSISFNNGDNLCGFLFGFQHTNTFLNRGLLYREKKCVALLILKGNNLLARVANSILLCRPQGSLKDFTFIFFHSARRSPGAMLGVK